MMPMPAYSATVASRKMRPIQLRGSPICSSTASTRMKAMKPPVYHAYTLLSCDLKARCSLPALPALPLPCSNAAMSALLGDAVLLVEPVHRARVITDDEDVDDQ